MAEQPDEKFKLPLAGMVALVVAAVSSLLIYQVPLKTARPIDKEAEKYVSVKADQVQARLWQDPFEAVSTHQLKKATSKPTGEGQAKTHHGFSDLMGAIKSEDDASPMLILPVFVDGNPYANGVESRLKDRYAVVSALGVAGYLPESGEYIRYVEWEQPGATVVVPAEWFLLDPTADSTGKAKKVLVLWLKDQDFTPTPLLALENLFLQMPHAIRRQPVMYRVLGPRTSGSLGAMLDELKLRDSGKPTDGRLVASFQTGASARPQDLLKGLVFYSSWATAADPFLLDDGTAKLPNKGVEEWFRTAGLTLIRTIPTDAVLAEQLVEELKRRRIDLTIPRETAGDCKTALRGSGPPMSGASRAREACPVPHVALISEWDTLYGRALPLTFVAMAETMAVADKAKETIQIGPELNLLHAGVWPTWVHRYSYLAGLDGELPPKGDGKDAPVSPAKGKQGEKISGPPQSTEEIPTGRSQLDYVRRLAETLKREGIEFSAIGVLGSDVYDKLMILQALRDDFPRAVFFTTDLDARLTHSGQGQWTRNLIVASHFGLQLHPDLQTPIPPFRDSYQTALFYSALQAVEYLLPLPLEHQEVRHSVTNMTYALTDKPRLYELGRHDAVDISLDEPRDIPSIHAPRPDLDPATGRLRLPLVRTIGLAVLAAGVALLCALLLNRELLIMLRSLRPGRMFLFMLVLGAMTVVVIRWAISDGATGEPFTLTQGISVWPTTAIRLVAFTLCLFFFYYASKRLREDDGILTKRFNLAPSTKNVVIRFPFMGIHFWRSDPVSDAVSAEALWHEYLALGQWPQRSARIVPQTFCYLLFGILLMYWFESPTMPCRGSVCFQLNYLVLALSVMATTLLLLYVVDATRLCRRLIKIMIATGIRWPHDLLESEAARLGVEKSYLSEWLGIELIAQRTSVISVMLYYPFIILFLMGVARHTYFDRWDFPVGLMVVFGLNAAYAFGNAVYLRRSAEEAKHAAVADLKAKQRALSVKTPFKNLRVQQIERMIDLIEKNQEGAFLPFTRHPLFGAIALPTGGTGLLFLIEYLASIM